MVEAELSPMTRGSTARASRSPRPKRTAASLRLLSRRLLWSCRGRDNDGNRGVRSDGLPAPMDPELMLLRYLLSMELRSILAVIAHWRRNICSTRRRIAIG